MRLYISGPVAGMEGRNAEDFKKAEKLLKNAGFDVSNPTKMIGSKIKRGEIVRCCLGELLRCQGVALLPGWRRSKGACLEVAVATACGMDAMAAEAWAERGEE